MSLRLLAYLSCQDSREFVLYRLQAWFRARSLAGSHCRKRNYLLFLSVKKLNSKNWIFLQKSSCGFWSVTLEALYQQRRDAALVTTTDSRCFHFAHNSLRNLIIFVSRYLKFWYLKRYVGGLVHSMNKQLHIDLLGLLLMRVSDDVRSASLFVRFLFLLKLKHNEQQ